MNIIEYYLVSISDRSLGFGCKVGGGGWTSIKIFNYMNISILASLLGLKCKGVNGWEVNKYQDI